MVEGLVGGEVVPGEVADVDAGLESKALSARQNHHPKPIQEFKNGY